MGISVDKKFKRGTKSKKIRDYLVKQYPRDCSIADITKGIGLRLTSTNRGLISATLHNGKRLGWGAWRRTRKGMYIATVSDLNTITDYNISHIIHSEW